MLGCWAVGLLSCWVVELLGCWVVVLGLLCCWLVGLLGCCVVRLLGYWVSNTAEKQATQQRQEKQKGQQRQKRQPCHPQPNRYGPAECAKRLNLTSRGNGKRNQESDVRMLLSAAICYYLLPYALLLCAFCYLFLVDCWNPLLISTNSCSHCDI